MRLTRPMKLAMVSVSVFGLALSPLATAVAQGFLA